MALVLTAFVLPSALNVPQTNPTQTLEYAPVPPSDENPAPTAGNAASLGLGSSDGLSGEGLGGELPPPPPPILGSGTVPRTKRCVGSPPRQTEDPMSPPCVAYFAGDNGGVTYKGVSTNEIRLIVYMEGEYLGVTSRGAEYTPKNLWVDLAKPAEPGESTYTTILRAWQRYFNERYQTYGRFVRFIVHYGGKRQEATPEIRRAQASEAYSKYGPFAYLSFAGQYSADQVGATTAKGMVTFLGSWQGMSSFGEPSEFFQRTPGLAWGYNATLDHRARLYSSYVCTKLKPHPVSFSGNNGTDGRTNDLGKPRKFALVREIKSRYGRMILDQVRKCGIDAIEVTFNSLDNSPAQYAQNMAQIQAAGVTTILWVSSNNYDTNSATSLNYYPEWMLAGDDTNEREFAARLYYHQDQARNLRAVTMYPATTDPLRHPCIRAFREVEPSMPTIDVRDVACQWYEHIRQVFIGIQVAGPRLTPQSMDQGMHAIPAIQNDDPRIPACFYGPGDYTCVKDAQAQWWDPNGQAPGRSGRGCFRLMEGGRRYLVGEWPAGDVERHRRPGVDQCTTQGSDVTSTSG